MTHPLVAIVTPVYNGERFLAETMDCVQTQTYPHLVHALLDNASTDGTAGIIDRYRHGRVPVLRARNAATIPAPYNWNAALRMMPPETKYFRLICADDLMAPSAIEKMVAVAESNPLVGLVGCQWRAGKLHGEELPRDATTFPGRDIVRRYLRCETMVLSGMFTLFRCDVARRFEPFYDPSIVGFDTNANLQLLRDADYGFVHEELVTWRHEGGVVSTVPERTLVHLAEWIILLDRYGASVMDDREFQTTRLASRRHYLRRLLLRFRRPGCPMFRQHMDDLRHRGDPAAIPDFADALLDWLKRMVLGPRRSMAGIPFRH